MKITKTKLMELIKEAIEDQLVERKFDPDILSKINFPNQSAMTDYVFYKMKLRSLGGGSSRIAFLIDSKRVLKVATNEAGFAQNKAEVEAYNNPEARLIVTKIFRFDPNYKWLLAELVRPLSRHEEFEKLTGVPWAIFVDLVSARRGGFQDRINVIRRYVAAQLPVYSQYTPESLEELLSSPFVQNVIKGLSSLQSKLMPGDLKRIEHWGKTPNQRVVLLDYGFNEDVERDHY